jgi:hypothetical protein
MTALDNKEMKDSLNREQCLELSTRLRQAGFTRLCVFISSNTNDFAEFPSKTRLHLDLQAEFTAAALEYFTSLEAAVGSLRARGQLPQPPVPCARWAKAVAFRLLDT